MLATLPRRDSSAVAMRLPAATIQQRLQNLVLASESSADWGFTDLLDRCAALQQPQSSREVRLEIRQV